MTKKNNGKTLKVENVFNRLSKNKRGISAVISSVIMVAAVIAVGLSVVAWTTGTFARQQSETGEFFNTENQKMRENFVIEDVWFNPSPRYVNVTVRNVGTVNMTVSAIYFDGINMTTLPPLPQNVMNGTALRMKIEWDWGSATNVYVSVASLRGQQIREYYSTTG